jgi:hypothetical protein
MGIFSVILGAAGNGVAGRSRIVSATGAAAGRQNCQSSAPAIPATIDTATRAIHPRRNRRRPVRRPVGGGHGVLSAAGMPDSRSAFLNASSMELNGKLLDERARPVNRAGMDQRRRCGGAVRRGMFKDRSSL